MKRREFIAGLLVAASLRHARAQQPAKVHRIAICFVARPIAERDGESWLSRPEWRVFFQELRRLGYIEGRNLIVEQYYGEPPTVELARDVLRSKPDVIFSLGQWVRILKPLTTIPIVGVLGDPVGLGLVASLARPGGNITGVSVDAGPGVQIKGLELLKQAFPQASRVGVLAAGSYLSELVRGGLAREQFQEAAQRLGLLLLAPRLEGTLQETEYRHFF